MEDSFGREYKIGDYVFCAVHARCSSVDTYVGRVVKINDSSISVANLHNWYSWKEKPYAVSALLVPERHLIIPEELALQKEPALKDVKLPKN